jgi:hypothetical protein
MALPASGPLSFSAIAAALCTPDSAPYSLRAMSLAAGFSTPDSVSEFYGYSCPNAYVEINNGTTTANISNVTINGVGVTDITFPVTAGNSANGLTNQLGTYSIVVFFNNGSGDSISVTDNTPTTSCANATGASRTFTNQVVSSGGVIYIDMEDGACV